MKNLTRVGCISKLSQVDSQNYNIGCVTKTFFIIKCINYWWAPLRLWHYVMVILLCYH